MIVPPNSTATVESLFVAHHSSLVRFVRRRVDDRELAEDLVAECYVRALIQERRSPVGAGWLYGTARNLIGDAYRRRERDQRLLQALAVAVAATSDSEHSPVIAALEELSAPDRELLVMLHLDDISPTDAAAALGVSLPAVWKRSSRARERVRGVLVRTDDIAHDVGIHAAGSVT